MPSMSNIKAKTQLAHAIREDVADLGKARVSFAQWNDLHTRTNVRRGPGIDSVFCKS